MDSNLGYFTIPVSDMQRARAFYGGLFGWEFAADASDNYAHVSNTSPPGGLHRAEGSSPQVWFRVESIQDAVAQVRKLGGQADEPKESSSGWSTACRDDQGTHFNLWQPAPGY